MLNRFATLAGAACFCLLLVGCGGGRKSFQIEPGQRLDVWADGGPHPATVSAAGTIDLGDPLGTFKAVGRSSVEVEREITDKVRALPMPSFGIAIATPAPRIPDYPADKMVAKDSVVVTVGDAAGQPQEVNKENGAVNVPGVGPLMVAGLTTEQAVQAMQAKWRSRPQGTFIDPVDALKVGDKVFVSIDGVTKTYTVPENGKLSIGELGDIGFANMTTDEVQSDITNKWLTKWTTDQKPAISFAFVGVVPEDGKIVQENVLRYTINGKTQLVTVADDGTADLQDIDKMRLSGLTAREAEVQALEGWAAKQVVRVYVQRVSPWVQHGPSFWLYVAGITVASFILIFGLARVNSRVRRWVVASFVFVSGAFWVFEFFLPTAKDGPLGGQNFLTPYINSIVAPTSNVLSGILLGLGVYSLLRVHGTRVTRRQTNWFYSLILLIAIPIMATVLLTVFSADNEYTLAPFWREARDYLFLNAYSAMDSAMFSLIAFFIISAAYRAFRLRSVEASILMITALVVLLGLLPFGQMLTQGIPSEGVLGSFKIENISQWVLQVISSPALRAIEFGIGVGVLAMSLRIWLNLERGALFD